MSSFSNYGVQKKKTITFKEGDNCDPYNLKQTEGDIAGLWITVKVPITLTDDTGNNLRTLNPMNIIRQIKIEHTRFETIKIGSGIDWAWIRPHWYGPRPLPLTADTTAENTTTAKAVYYIPFAVPGAALPWSTHLHIGQGEDCEMVLTCGDESDVHKGAADVSFASTPTIEVEVDTRIPDGVTTKEPVAVFKERFFETPVATSANTAFEEKRFETETTYAAIIAAAMDDKASTTGREFVDAFNSIHYQRIDAGGKLGDLFGPVNGDEINEEWYSRFAPLMSSYTGIYVFDHFKRYGAVNSVCLNAKGWQEIIATIDHDAFATAGYVRFLTEQIEHYR